MKELSRHFWQLRQLRQLRQLEQLEQAKQIGHFHRLGQCMLTFMIFFAMTSVTFARLPDFVDLVKDASPAVVNITIASEVETPYGGGRRQELTSIGTGFIISKDGYIVTNHHVIDGASKVYINFEGQTNLTGNLEATIIGIDPETDLALLKVENKKALPFLEFGDSDKLEVGEWLIAIGNAHGLRHTVTAGILSAKGRDNMSGTPFSNFLQTDAAVNPGNSGGPLINMDGEVIGVNTFIYNSEIGGGLAFAIPSNLTENIIDQLRSGEGVSRGWLGVTIQDIDEGAAKALGIEDTNGAFIASVLLGEPADKAGLKAGDVVIKVGNTDIRNSSDLLRTIASFRPNDKVELEIIRNANKKIIVVTLAQRASQQVSEEMGNASFSLGISVQTVTEEDLESLNIEKEEITGLMVMSVKTYGAASIAGILTNDIILTANLKPVTTPKELAQIIQVQGKERGAVMLQIYRDNSTFFVTIPLSPE